MTLIEKNFSKNKTDSIHLIKSLQKATRTLQRICNEVRQSENVAMVKHVPLVKKCLADLITRVKAMCVANNCPEVFTVATLKNKNVQGEEILEQEEKEEEEEMGDEEEDGGDEDDGQNETDVEGEEEEEEEEEITYGDNDISEEV